MQLAKRIGFLNTFLLGLVLVLSCSHPKVNLKNRQQSNIRQILHAYGHYHDMHKSFPDSIEPVKDFDDEMKLIDEWGVKLKIETGQQVRVSSAGPDKEFDTADDLTDIWVPENLNY